jgi:hypothetical protein
MQNMTLEYIRETQILPECELLLECINEIDKLSALIKRIDETVYTERYPLFSDASVGMHIRHCIEFYTCIMNSGAAEISYEKRERNILLETIPQVAIDELTRIRTWLLNPSGREVLNIGFISGETDYQAQSSFLRELYFVNEHLVHHLALIRIGLTASGYASLFNEDFGVASSTRRFKNS